MKIVKSKKFLLSIFVLLLMCGVVFGYREYKKQDEIRQITSFNACKTAGYPILESYPAQCMTPDGRSFTQDVGNALEYRDEIVVETPVPGQMLMSAYSVRGKARGSWFSEGSFSGELLDAKGTLLGTVILQATGEWMTTEFVPFTGQLIFEAPVTDTGTLVIRNANPSGLPEHQKKLLIPVIF